MSKQTMDCGASSNLTALSYDADNKELEVTFKNGAVYVYDGVAEDRFEAFRSADSLGKYLNANIRPNYACRRLA